MKNGPRALVLFDERRELGARFPGRGVRENRKRARRLERGAHRGGDVRAEEAFADDRRGEIVNDVRGCESNCEQDSQRGPCGALSDTSMRTLTLSVEAHP